MHVCAPELNHAVVVSTELYRVTLEGSVDDSAFMRPLFAFVEEGFCVFALVRRQSQR